MKKIMAFVLATGLFLSSQAAMAGASKGFVFTDSFDDESGAVVKAKVIVEQIDAGKHTAVVSVAERKCQNASKAKYDATRFTVNPIWIENEDGFRKEYQAQIDYNFSCDMKVLSIETVYN